MKVIIYGDFNCLYCHLSSQRADWLVRAGTANVEWRAADHRPRLPVTGAKPPPGGAGGDDDMAEAARLALPADWLPAIGPVRPGSEPERIDSRSRSRTEVTADRVITGCIAPFEIR